MSLSPTIKREPKDENEPRNGRARRGKLSAAARKAVQSAKQFEEMAVREEEQNFADHERVSALANLATGGSFSAILKKSPALNDEQRAFLKELGYI
jgi:hypothetical protein